jgi:hypothetical protein
MVELLKGPEASLDAFDAQLVARFTKAKESIDSWLEWRRTLQRKGYRQYR